MTKPKFDITELQFLRQELGQKPMHELATMHNTSYMNVYYHLGQTRTPNIDIVRNALRLLARDQGTDGATYKNISSQLEEISTIVDKELEDAGE